ncbi:glycine betaine ABC transporter substrate-binding protein, partial [Escherichia coli]
LHVPQHSFPTRRSSDLAPAPVVRESVLKEYPQMAQWLQPDFASLDAKTLQQLNASIAVEGLDRKSTRLNSSHPQQSRGG